MENEGIRHSLMNNMGRTRTALKRLRGVTVSKDGTVKLDLRQQSEFNAELGEHLTVQLPEVRDEILISTDFSDQRRYVQLIVKQINGCYQFGFFDACAVMMRRLAEVLIIDAYCDIGNDEKIRDANNNLVMMSGLVNALTSGVTFKLSRNAPKTLELLKTLGDTAAHSRSYITKRKDIDDFAQSYRMLVEELRDLG